MCGSDVLTSSHFLVLMFCCLYWQSREKSLPLIQNFEMGGERVPDPPLVWLLANCGGFSRDSGIHRTSGLYKNLWFFFWFLQRTKYFEFWSGVDAEIGDSILLELGQDEGACPSPWRRFMDLLSAYSVLDAVCSLSCEGVFISVFQLRNLRLQEALRILV